VKWDAWIGTYLILVEVDSSVGVVAEELSLESLVTREQAVRTDLGAASTSTTLTVVTTRVFAIIILPLGAPGGRGSLRAVEEALSRCATLAEAVRATAGSTAVIATSRVVLAEVGKALIRLAILGSVLATLRARGAALTR
jgi:hypothetical protein